MQQNFNDQWSPHRETNEMICSANQVNGFYMTRALMCKCSFSFQKHVHRNKKFNYKSSPSETTFNFIQNLGRGFFNQSWFFLQVTPIGFTQEAITMNYSEKSSRSEIFVNSIGKERFQSYYVRTTSPLFSSEQSKYLLTHLFPMHHFSTP